jgi:hypothetical protein
VEELKIMVAWLDEEMDWECWTYSMDDLTPDNSNK